MISVSISEELKKKISDLSLCCIYCDVKVEERNGELWDKIELKTKEILERKEVEQISKQPVIASSRKAYKACGKDPARYRLSAESLFRRAVKQKEIFQINNVVDLVNFTSLSTGYSIGGYDAEKIQGDVIFGIGKVNECYHAIGRGGMNISNLPVFRDALGAFGSPTSDSERTAVTLDTKKFLMIIIDFGQPDQLKYASSLAIDLLKQHAVATDIIIKTLTLK